MITKISCSCGNTDIKKAKYYHGLLGYEAIVCNCCGSYSDYYGMHPKDEWSISYLKSFGISV